MPDERDPNETIPTPDDEFDSTVPTTPAHPEPDTTETVPAETVRGEPESAGTIPADTVRREPDSTETVPADTVPGTSATSPAETVPPSTGADTSDSLPTGAGGIRLREDDAKAPKLIAGRFEVLKMLGKGGLGRVYKVKDRQIQGREVALKVLRSKYSKNPRFKELFFDEIRAAQQFVDEHVNQVRDTGEAPETGELFLTMDLVEGESLRDLLKRENALNTRHAFEITRQVLLGLGSGHEHGLVHRDVKPENTMLAARIPKTDDNPYGVGVRLLDFGLAAVAAEVSEGVISGTPMYMSPEQAQGQRLDARSDLFAVGIVLYEMVTGTRPFHGESVDNIITSVIETDVSPLIDKLDHLSKPVHRILKKALEKKREKRYQSAADFLKAIEKSPAYKVPTATPTWNFALLSLAVIGAGSGYGLWWKANETNKEQANELTAKQSEINSLELEMIRAGEAKDDQVAELEATIGELRGKLGDSKNEALDAQTTRDDDIVRLETRVELLEKEDVNQRKLIADLTNERDEERRSRINFETANTDLQGRVNEMEAQLTKFQSQSDFRYVAAAGVDMIIRRLNNSDAHKARGKYWDLIDREAIVDAGEVDWADFLNSLTETALNLQIFRSVEDAERRNQSLEIAKRSLAEATSRFPGFRDYTRDWIGYVVEEDPPPDRLAQLEELLEWCTEGLEAAKVTADETRLADWLELANRPKIDRDLSPEILSLGRSLGRSRGEELVEPYVADYAEWLRETCVASGELNLNGLMTPRHLQSWGKTIADDRDLRRFGPAADVLAFSYARRWYDDDDENDELDWSLLEVNPLALPGPLKDWRKELYLKEQLVNAPSGFQGGRDSKFLYRCVSDAGKLTWRLEEVQPTDPPSDATVGWSVKGTIYHDDGRLMVELPERKLSLVGKRYVEEGKRTTPIARLDDVGAGYKVAIWNPGTQPEIPTPRIPLLASLIDGFWAELESDPVECLVIEEKGGRKVWFSPRWGLVRDENPDGVSRDLVHASIVR